MADNLIFPIGFDLEAAVKKAESEGASAMKRLENTFSRQPLVLKTDTSGFDELGKSAEVLKSRLKEIKDQWDKMPTSVKFDFDSEGKVKQLTADGKALWDELLRINTALQGVSMGIQQMARESQRQLEAENKAEQKREQAIAASLKAEYKRIEAKKQTEAASRRELQMLNQQYAAEERRQRLASSEASVAKRQQVIKTLRAEENTIVNITAKLQHWQQVMNSSAMDGRQFKRATEEVQRLSQKLSEAQARISQLTATTSNASARQSAAIRQVNQEFKNQETYVSRLLKRMAVYASFSYASNFLTSVREVTAEFELQRISLGAIIQDQARANQLFEEIKTFALKSPVKILDLTKYTKQLAAYKIGVDELFDTTKRLTDISVGLGVSMDRIVLMYGQIRATGYLRASEVRQATEAGIPLVEELANKLSKANGELVTAADVMDMISKRAISFDMVKEVFDDMTSAGGIFYNMQEKQGNTLYGMWQKLGDAAAVMYDQIGNTSSVNDGMKMAIQSLRYLMLHWKQVGIVVGGVSVYILANAIATKNNAIATAAATTANKLHIASLQQKLGALRLEQMNLKSTSIFQRLHTAATISATKAQIGAATSTNVFSKALHGLKAALLSNPLTALAVALTTIIALLMQSESELDKLNSKLQDIDRDYDASGKKSVDRFKELVKAVEENVDGSKAQKEALDELDRTYGKILGSEALELDSLKALGGQYAELIDLIEAYNAKKRGEEKKTAIESTSATIKDEAKDDLMDYLNQAGMSKEKQIEFMARLNEKLIEYAGQADAAIKATDETFKEFADDISQLDSAGNILNVLDPDKLFDAWGVGFRAIGGWFGGKGMSYLYDYANAMQKERELLEENEIATRNAVRGLDEYAEGIDNVGKALKNLDWSSQEALYNSLQDYNKKNPQTALSIPINLEFDPSKAQSEYEKMIEIGNMQIHAIFANLQNIASQEGVAIPEEFYKQAKSVVEGNKSFSFIDFEGLSKLFTSKKAKQAVAESKLLFESISPNDRTVAVFRTKLAQLASGAGVELSSMTKYFMKAGDNIEDYAKKIKEAIEELEKKLKEMQTTNQMIEEGGHGPLQGFSEEEIKKIQMQVAVLKELFPFLQGFTKGGSTRTSDPRLQTLQEIANKMAEVNKEYDDLLKKEGQTKALADTQKLFASSFEQMKATAKKYGFKLPAFEVPQTIEDVQKWYKAIMDNIKRLKLKNADKVLIELGFKSDKAAIDKQQKDIEAELKRLADRISRTKTAKEFYEKILGQTGDVELATRVSLSIYGSTGEELFEDTVKQIKEVFKTGNKELDETIEMQLDYSIDTKNERINYQYLAEIYDYYQDQIIEKNRSTAENIVKEGQKTAASNIATWEKELAKAKDYEEQRTDIINRETQRRAEIYKSNLPQEEKDRLAAQSQRKQDEDLAKINFDEFTKSEDYIKIFENLDNVATSSLKRLRAEMQALIDTNQNLSPENMKTLVKAMEDIDEQISGRGFGNDMIQSVNDYIASIKNLKIAKQELAEAEAEYQAQLPQLDEDIVTAENEKVEAQRGLNDLKNNELATENQIVAAELRLNTATANVAKAQQAKAKAADKVKKAEQKVTGEQDKQKKATTKFVKDLQKVASTADQLAGELSEIKELLGISEDSAAGLVFDSAISSLQTMSTAINAATTAQAIFNAIAESNPYIAIAAGVLAVGSAIASWISGSKVRKANKEIERQQELLNQLEYTYGRLEKAADKAFGVDYLQNHNQQIKNLEAQQQAYLKQAQAERSKGKKADKEKIKEYEEQARETADKIKELQDDLAGQIVGTDVASAARDFANAWLDAYLSFGSTTDAIKEKFDDMIKNMIVNMVLAQVVKRALEPIFKMIDDLAKDGELSAADIAKVFAMVPQSMKNINNGLSVGMEALKAAGVDISKLREGSSEFSGIAKNVAGATSEEINNVAAIGNTLMYYVSPIPRIDENLAKVVAIMEGRGAALPTASGTTLGAVDYTDLFTTANQHLSSLPRMEQHLSEIHSMLGRALKTKGSTTGFNTFLNS